MDFQFQVPGVLVSMSAGLCSLSKRVVENKVKTQASFIEHLGKFTFRVCVYVCLQDKERELCLHVYVVVDEILSRQNTHIGG